VVGTEGAELTKADAKRVLDALDAVVLDESQTPRKSGSAGSCSSPCASSPPRRNAPAATPRPESRSRSPPKPASVDVHARPLARAKQALPSVQKARRRLAA